MRKPTKIHHLDLKREVTVDERAVPIWESSGWKPGPLPETAGEEPSPSDDAPSDDAPPAESVPGEAPAAPRPTRVGKPKTPAAPPATPDA